MKERIATLRSDARTTRIPAPGASAVAITSEGDAWVCRARSYASRVSFDGREITRAHLPSTALHAQCTTDGSLVAACFARIDAFGVRMRNPLIVRLDAEGRERSRAVAPGTAWISDLCVGDDDRAYFASSSVYECVGDAVTQLLAYQRWYLQLERSTNALYSYSAYDIVRVLSAGERLNGPRPTPAPTLNTYALGLYLILCAPVADGTLWIAARSPTNFSGSTLRRVRFETAGTTTPSAPITTIEVQGTIEQLLPARDGGVWALTKDAVLLRFGADGDELGAVRLTTPPANALNPELRKIQLCRNERFVCGKTFSTHEVLIVDLRSVGLA